MLFLNASVLPRKSLNRNLSWGFPLGNLLTKTRVLEHCVLKRKREPNANASVLGTLRFRALSSGLKIGAPQKRQIEPRRIQPTILGPLIAGEFWDSVGRGARRGFRTYLR